MRRLVAGVLAAAGILLAGCAPAPAQPAGPPSASPETAGAEAAGPAGATEPAPTASPQTPGPPLADRLTALLGQPGEPARIALLGDSFAAGDGAGSYLPVDGVTDSLCHRSAEALLAGALAAEHDGGKPGAPPADAGPVVTNYACSRALVSSLQAAQPVAGHEPAGVPAQLTQLAGQRSDLVLLYVGGNDLGFANLLQACVLNPEPCSSDPALRAYAADNALRLQASLAELYPAVAEAAVTAPVLVLPYPRLFEPVADCGRLTPEELAFGLEITDLLNSTIKQAVSAAALPNVHYVDALEDSIAGRGACSVDPLVNPARIGALLDAAGSESASLEVLHPTAEGYRVLTGDLLEWMESHPL